MLTSLRLSKGNSLHSASRSQNLLCYSKRAISVAGLAPLTRSRPSSFLSYLRARWVEEMLRRYASKVFCTSPRLCPSDTHGKVICCPADGHGSAEGSGMPELMPAAPVSYTDCMLCKRQLKTTSRDSVNISQHALSVSLICRKSLPRPRREVRGQPMLQGQHAHI